MRVALIHTYLVNIRGSERVYYALSELFPQADLYALVCDRDSQPSVIRDRNVQTSFVQKLPWSRRLFRLYLPLYPLAIEQFDLRAYNVVLTSSSAWTHGVLVQPETCHICYCHSPFRYAWNWYHELMNNSKMGSVAKPLLIPILSWIRTWDYIAAQRVDYFVANSKVTQARIARYYNRDSIVIHPPIEVERFSPSQRVGDYFLTVSALLPYKRIDIAVSAFNSLGLQLRIVGDGPQRRHLETIAESNIEFLGNLSDQDVAQVYSRCKALIFTAEEDFGIVPLEAQASGRPVIAYGAGGSLETVVDGVTGKFFSEQTPESLINAIEACNPSNFDPMTIREHALKFDTSVFKRRIKDFVETKYHEHRQRFS